jgi:hypothetical protein
MFPQDFIAELHHLDATDLKAGGLKTREDRTDELLFDGIRFEQYK